ncbi:MAG: hypothetical protein HKN48_02845 [Flavobacteriaceae bacterium]|nr:hypothetical protein [Flavobacteriaceae bacterium]
MNNHYRNFVIGLIGFTGLLLAVHYYIFYNFFSEIELYLPLWGIYAFNAVLVFIVYSVINYKVSQGSDKAYQIFLTATIVKMVLSIVFLLPIFLGKSDNKQVEVINFFIPYFLFLVFEIMGLNKFFQNQETK